MFSSRVVAEIGLNHLGSLEEAKRLLEILKTNGLSRATIQIRESSFYQSHKEYFLSKDSILQIIDEARNKNIEFGLALGPLESFEEYDEIINKADFIKLLSISVENKDFLERYLSLYLKKTYYSLGTSNIDYVKEVILPNIKKNDFLLHTSLTHEASGQNLADIYDLSSQHKNIAFGHHCREPSIISVAIGAGAKEVFIYIGNKSLKLPDYDHAFDSSELPEIMNQFDLSFRSLKTLDSSEIEQITFIG
tara:strand:+ start:751 stop:1497 length:747 start_codon:yes stop_codon:yes gene_type:complete